MTVLQTFRLADLVPMEIRITRGLPTQHAKPYGDMPVMSIAALRSGAEPRYFADHNGLDSLGLDPAQPGDILVATEGSRVGEAMVVPDAVDPFVPTQQVATMRVLDQGRLDPWYIGAWLSTEPATEQVRRLTRGSGVQRIAVKDLSLLVLAVPPLADQHEIGKRYRAFEDAIRAHRALTACLEELRDLDLLLTFARAVGSETSANQPHPKEASSDPVAAGDQEL
jgi:hypothetical protein